LPRKYEVVTPLEEQTEGLLLRTSLELDILTA